MPHMKNINWKMVGTFVAAAIILGVLKQVLVIEETLYSDDGTRSVTRKRFKMPMGNGNGSRAIV